MTSHLFLYLSYVFSLVSLLLLVQGRTIFTIKKENYDDVKNESILQNEGYFLRYTKRFTVPYFLSDNHPLAEGDSIQHQATIRWPYESAGNDLCYGTMATLNVYALPEVGDGQVSTAGIWVANGVNTPDNFNGIQAGWHVYPELYGDHDTHFYVAWNVGKDKTGCYNLVCEGFIPHKDSKHIPGSKLEPLSKIDGPQYELSIKISQDNITKDWWLSVGSDLSEPVGYWPKSIFTSLVDGASALQWGGSVKFHPNQNSPPMGSGLYPKEGYGRAAYLKDVVVEYERGIFSKKPVSRNDDQTDCYQIDGEEPYYFGGPGGCTS